MDQELFRIIKEHLLRHPYMQPEDVIKLVFQNEFGPAHLSLEPEEALSHIRDELEAVCYEEDALLYEDIGNGYCRVNFRAADPYDYTAEMLAEDFLQSLNGDGSAERFTEKLYGVMAHADEFHFPFPEEELIDTCERYLAYCRDTGPRPVHHSERYRREGRPAYRVILKTRMRDFAEEKDGKLPKGRRILKRILLYALILALFAGLCVLGAYLYQVIAL